MTRKQPSVQEGKWRQHAVSIMTFPAFSTIVIPVRQVKGPQLLSHRLCKPSCDAVENSTDKKKKKSFVHHLCSWQRRSVYRCKMFHKHILFISWQTIPTSPSQTKYTGNRSNSLLYNSCCRRSQIIVSVRLRGIMGNQILNSTLALAPPALQICEVCWQRAIITPHCHERGPLALWGVTFQYFERTLPGF